MIDPISFTQPAVLLLGADKPAHRFTHQVRLRDPNDGSEFLTETKVGATMLLAVEDIFDLCDRFDLVAVHRHDFANGTIRDVTSNAIYAVAECCQQDGETVPERLKAAFAERNIPLPPKHDIRDTHRIEWPEPSEEPPVVGEITPATASYRFKRERLDQALEEFTVALAQERL